MGWYAIKHNKQTRPYLNKKSEVNILNIIILFVRSYVMHDHISSLQHIGYFTLSPHSQVGYSSTHPSQSCEIFFHITSQKQNGIFFFSHPFRPTEIFFYVSSLPLSGTFSDPRPQLIRLVGWLGFMAYQLL